VQRIDALALPPNFLDTLIEKLGGPGAVAEMTGRKGRVIRDSKGHGVYELRAKPDSSEMDSLNVKEAGGLGYHLQVAAKLPFCVRIKFCCTLKGTDTVIVRHCAVSA